MAIVDYSKQNEFNLVNDEQDCRGWTVVDQSGNKIGTVTEMLVNTETMAVDSIIVDRMKRIPAADFALQTNKS
jgi:sporulation protein YlmC with PRC-barrel domain